MHTIFNFTATSNDIRMKLSLLFAFLCCSISLFGQLKPQNGVIESEADFYALKHATIYVSPTKKLSNATILIKNNTIVKVGVLLKVPKNAVVIDCENKVILPSFIELYTNVGLPKVKAETWSSRPQYETSKEGAFYWNQAVHPEIDAAEHYVNNAKSTKPLMEKGFGFALSHQTDGIIRGQGALVSLGAEEAILDLENPSSYFSFEKGVSRQSYPSSLMGSIALMRQTLYDARWYASNHSKKNLSLEALNKLLSGNLYLKTRDKLDIIRAKKIADEFNLTFSYIGSGNEYEIVNELKDVKSTIVIPIDFPEAYDVKNPYVSRQIPLSDLKHWEMAPQNPSILLKNGIHIAISSENTKNKTVFWDNLRKAINHGLTIEQALNALTMSPAMAIGAEKQIGSLESGKLASFMVYDQDPFTTKGKVIESWSMGKRTVFERTNDAEIAGEYALTIADQQFSIKITGTPKKLKGELTYKTTTEGLLKDTTSPAIIELSDNDITIQFHIQKEGQKGSVNLRGKINTKFGVFEGSGFLPNGEWVKWAAVKSKKSKTIKPSKKSNSEIDSTNYAWLPNMAYGFERLPTTETIVIKNATIWTNEDQGIIDNGLIIIKKGKISFVGDMSHRPPALARVIDAKGKHVTSGIIDEHSHIAISKGVNESGQAISAEVSIAHVVNPDDINIYRQLSGGVTAAQLLHGSANPIGGQSALIKLKWGHSAEEMLIDQAPKFIKFALGENVKQSNWGINSGRFPQTRMGVEQIYYDGFIRAMAYANEWKAFKSGKITSPPRTDLELEVLTEILNSDRFISCHSYVQSEINMLMHVADSMGFTINTFTHILEGYKVADKMKAHGAGGSTFSDWWAYKYEVNDAIPYNASVMHEQGIVVAINSDDAEMGRRLNQEAAKSVKYGGMSEEDAWKLVTLNPAKLLHLDQRMGSVKVGKDADIVIWSHNPLSVLAKVNYTIIDGVVLFDHQKDIELRKRNLAERARIISKMLDKNKAGNPSRTFVKKKKGHYHCDTIGEELSTEENHH
ncbi:MAG: amidohydrolase family protein [Crocinitomicaceae bacterium]|nr:amidohydrolase family protein [Crocinitomicaceae bacterium]